MVLAKQQTMEYVAQETEMPPAPVRRPGGVASTYLGGTGNDGPYAPRR
jgi:hypothetical protein